MLIFRAWATSGERRLNYARCAKLSPKIMLAQGLPWKRGLPQGGAGELPHKDNLRSDPILAAFMIVMISG